MSAEDRAVTAIEEAHFRRVLGHFPTGVAVVTAVGADGSPAGLSVGSFFSVSLAPPLVAICPSKTSTSYPKIEAAGHFVVNILAEHQEELCRRFASKADDKFAGLGYGPSDRSGAPVLDGALAWIDCDIDAVHDAGDHRIVVGLVRALDVVHEGSPLVFFRGGYGRFTSG